MCDECIKYISYIGIIMTIEQLVICLEEHGFLRLEGNTNEFIPMFRLESQAMNVVMLVNGYSNHYISRDQYHYIQEKVVAFFKERGIADVHILTLYICENVTRGIELIQGDPLCWIISKLENKLYIYENQVSDFYGLKGLLEEFLLNPKQFEIKTNDSMSQNKTSVIKRIMTMSTNQWLSLPLVCIGLVVINVILFVMCTIIGDMLYNIGDLSVVFLISYGEYYRLISSIFLHADMNHLISNMLILYYIGMTVEHKVGHMRFLCLYMVSGVVGSIASVSYELATNQVIRTVGASGAVFGIMAGLVILVIGHKGRMGQMTFGRVLFMASFALYSGFTSAGINNAAHVGGFIAGLLITILFWISSKKVRMN